MINWCFFTIMVVMGSLFLYFGFLGLNIVPLVAAPLALGIGMLVYALGMFIISTRNT